MPANKKLCLKLINRFGPAANFPRGNLDAINALAECLVQRACSDAHAQAAADSFAESGDRCPTEGDLVRVLNETRGKHAPNRQIGCPQCIEGWRHVWFLTTKSGGRKWEQERISQERARLLESKLDRKTQEITEAVELCQCVGGRQVAA